MNQSVPLLRNISDTARWAAVFRARESERAHALFHDPYAHRLAGERGELIASAMPNPQQSAWAWAIRTYLFDQLIMEQIEHGVDMVINLAAGLDARPYRMFLPSTLKWVEVDLPEIFDYKEQILADERPRCHLQRIRLDLSDVEGRREVFRQLGEHCAQACVLTEGLLIYLHPDHVGLLARDLAEQHTFRHWITDLASPGLMKMLNKTIGKVLAEAGAPFCFAPAEGPEFFSNYFWKPLAVRSMLKEAAKVKRLPWLLHLLSYLPERKRPGKRPWSGVCLLGNVNPA
jgi:methyltransferase (TIGR00027 family)